MSKYKIINKKSTLPMVEFDSKNYKDFLTSFYNSDGCGDNGVKCNNCPLYSADNGCIAPGARDLEFGKRYKNVTLEVIENEEEYTLCIMDLKEGEKYESSDGYPFTFNETIQFHRLDRFKLVQKNEPETTETKWYRSNTGEVRASFNNMMGWQEVKPINDDFTKWEKVQ